MATTYTSNQTWAIACILAAALWGLTATGVNIMTGAVTGSSNIAYSVLVIIAWILVPLYAKLVRLAFIVGIILNIIAMIGVAASPAATPWYAFTNPVYNFSFIIWYLTCWLAYTSATNPTWNSRSKNSIHPFLFFILILLCVSSGEVVVAHQLW